MIDLPGASQVSAAVYDLGGRKLFDVLNGTELSSGENKVTFTTGGLNSGIYWVRVIATNNVQTIKFSVKKQ